MKTDLKVEHFLIHQTYFTDNHADTPIQGMKAWLGKKVKKGVKKNLQRLQTEWMLIYQTPQKRNRHLGVTQRG